MRSLSYRGSAGTGYVPARQKSSFTPIRNAGKFSPNCRSRLRTAFIRGLAVRHRRRIKVLVYDEVSFEVKMAASSLASNERSETGRFTATVSQGASPMATACQLAHPAHLSGWTCQRAHNVYRENRETCVTPGARRTLWLCCTSPNCASLDGSQK